MDNTVARRLRTIQSARIIATRLAGIALIDLPVKLAATTGNACRPTISTSGRLSFTSARGDEASWRRFIKGAYNHPITWWIGIFQLTMQMGIWGFRYRSMASTRASTLWQLSEPLRDEVSGLLKGEDMPLLSDIVRYNLKYRKADIIGRFTGGTFTDFASTGGRFGAKRLSKTEKRIRGYTNFGIASYGAAIKALAEEHKTLEAIIQSVLTGCPEHLPNGYRSDNSKPLSDEEGELLKNLESALGEVTSLTQVELDPVPIKEFCSRPENINLKGLCK